MLYQVNYQELKSLVLQYPYAPNLRLLLALKSLFDDHQDYDHNLTLASVYSIDRKKLHEQIKRHVNLRGVQENYSLGEDFLELKDLTTIEDILEAEKTPPANQEAQHSIPLEEDISNIESIRPVDFQEEPAEEENEDLDFLENLAGEVKNSQPGSPVAGDDMPGEIDTIGGSSDKETATDEQGSSMLLEDLPEREIDAAEAPANHFLESIDDAVSVAAVVEGMVTEQDDTPADNRSIPLEITNDDEALQPIPKSSFNSWLQQFKPPEVHALSVHMPEAPNRDEKKEEVPAPKDEAREVAARSVAEDFGVASETLAALLEAHGHYDKAIAMYERLCLQYPEKSSFFAAQIEKLKNK